MAHKVLVPIDPSPISRGVVDLAENWCRMRQAQPLYLHVKPWLRNWDIKMSELENWIRERHPNALCEIVEHGGPPYHTILERAQEIRASHIIMGAHAHSAVGRFLLGSNTDYVVHHAHCPVYVHKRSEPRPLEPIILVPVDFTDINRPVLEFAADWARQAGAKLHLIHVLMLEESFDLALMTEFGYFQPEASATQAGVAGGAERDALIEETRGKLEKFAAKSGVENAEISVRVGKPNMELVAAQKELGARWIAMAAHSYTTLGRWLAGHTTDYLLHHATCDLWIYKRHWGYPGESN